MSDLAEFAEEFHLKYNKRYHRTLEPIEYPSKTEKLKDIRAVICDVHGTLVNYLKEEFTLNSSKENALLTAFEKVAEYFEMNEVLQYLVPASDAATTLRDFYHGLLSLRIEEMKKKEELYPEVKVDEVWEALIVILMRNGYKHRELSAERISDFARKVAWVYNFYALGRELYPGVIDAIQRLQKDNIICGILSNGQFYTPLDLTLMIRDQDNGSFEDIYDLFDPDFIFFSYEYMVSKPHQLLFRKLYDVLYEYNILPSQTVYVGNDLLFDIKPAQEAGMRTAFFTGDKDSVYLHDLADKVIPDITFSHWETLPDKISFYSGERT
ncbi:MAG: HAD family hydrolase [Chitinispirillaceae bacterium]|nr:HAD family hydrolase [Chitinispirillaceae bacterium]